MIEKNKHKLTRIGREKAKYVWYWTGLAIAVSPSAVALYL